MKVLLGITGGIAAYKACDIISGLRATNHEVKVIVTKNALNFITELTLSSLSGNKVTTTMWQETHGDIEHISNAQWADVLLIAPCTANMIAKLNYGIADDCLSTVALALGDKTKKIIAPAMNTNMWLSEPVTHNIDILASLDWIIIPPIKGKLACGDMGTGKLAKPRTIVERVNELIN